jgi:hypothetical protein
VNDPSRTSRTLASGSFNPRVSHIENGQFWTDLSWQCAAVVASAKALRGTPMRHSQLSNEQILLALSESYNIIAAITKYQLFLASAIGLPKDDTGRIELMTASITAVEKIRTEIRALEHELDRREGKEKSRF